jgi:type IV secretory pathway VirD2 relaxase
MSLISNISEQSMNKNNKLHPTSKTTVNEGSTRHSTEISFANFILNQFLNNTKKAMNNIFKKFTENDNCMKCSNAEDLDVIDFRINPDKVLAMKASKQKSKKIDESILDRKKFFILTKLL